MSLTSNKREKEEAKKRNDLTKQGENLPRRERSAVNGGEKKTLSNLFFSWRQRCWEEVPRLQQNLGRMDRGFSQLFKSFTGKLTQDSFKGKVIPSTNQQMNHILSQQKSREGGKGKNKTHYAGWWGTCAGRRGEREDSWGCLGWQSQHYKYCQVWWGVSLQQGRKKVLTKESAIRRETLKRKEKEQLRNTKIFSLGQMGPCTKSTW